MRIGIARVESADAGGFERVIDRLVGLLRRRGDEVVDFGARFAPAESPFGTNVPEIARSKSHFFQYASLIEAFNGLDASGVDVLVSCHPPSFAVHHDRHLSVFMHHQRSFYDVMDLWRAAGVEDEAGNNRALDAVRAVDQVLLDGVSLFLAGSQEVAQRLNRYNGLRENVQVLQCGPGLLPEDRPGPPGDRILCVSRQTFLKRTELFVQAMRYLDPVPGVLVGTGDRADWVRHIDASCGRMDVDLDSYTPTDLWLNTGRAPSTSRMQEGRSSVHFAGRIDDVQLRRAYADALCVVAPAFGEDYGLTGVEALTFGRPLIVCKDGGALTEFVVDGENGFVVEPTGRAIADAVRVLLDDRSLATGMGASSLARSEQFSWAAAESLFLKAVADLAA